MNFPTMICDFYLNHFSDFDSIPSLTRCRAIAWRTARCRC